jgi:GrpB-like predicted nucleotidyltransferase (UPF0157 family)
VTITWRYAVLGLEKGVVRLVPYSPDWKLFFILEKAHLQQVLGSAILDIQHIGSTSIPGMPAKPIIDIAIGVQDFERARPCIPLIEGLGYEYRGEFGIPHRHYFVKGNPRLFHLHMSEITSNEWKNALLFRNYLCRHPEAAKEYALLKQQLASKYTQDREAYLEGKTEFIQRIIQIASSEVEIG